MPSHASPGVRRGLEILERFMAERPPKELARYVVLVFVDDKDAHAPTSGSLETGHNEHGWRGVRGPGFRLLFAPVDEATALLRSSGGEDEARELLEAHRKALADDGFAFVVADWENYYQVGNGRFLPVRGEGVPEA